MLGVRVGEKKRKSRCPFNLGGVTGYFSQRCLVPTAAREGSMGRYALPGSSLGLGDSDRFSLCLRFQATWFTANSGEEERDYRLSTPSQLAGVLWQSCAPLSTPSHICSAVRGLGERGTRLAEVEVAMETNCARSQLDAHSGDKLLTTHADSSHREAASHPARRSHDVLGEH